MSCIRGEVTRPRFIYLAVIGMGFAGAVAVQPSSGLTNAHQ